MGLLQLRRPTYVCTYVQDTLTLVTAETDYGVGEVVSVYVVYVCVNCSQALWLCDTQ